MNLYRVLFVAGCPNSVRISKSIAKELTEISADKVKCEMINTYRLEHDKAYRKPGILKGFVGDNRIITAKKILEEKSPDIIIVGDDGGINAFIVKLALLRSIPVIAVQVGMLSEEVRKSIKSIFRWRRYFLWRLFSRIIRNRLISKILVLIRWKVRVLEWGLGGTDLVAVMGDYYKELMIKRSVPPHKVVVYGYVLLDEIVRSASSEMLSHKLDNIPRLDQTKKKILLLSQTLVEDNICSLNKYINILEALIGNLNSEYQLIIKPHPREDTGKYTRFINKYPDRVIITSPKHELAGLVFNAEIVSTFQSTSGLTALVYKKPLVIIDIAKFPYVNLLKSLGATIDTIEGLRDFAQDPPDFIKSLSVDYKENIRKHLYRLDGNASLRVARAILKIISKSPPRH
ncbi:MAG: polysialyltransferase family glycosyltransferase [Candidatus Hodarchaeota archaeon]